MKFDPFLNNIYMTIVTITTVGYGDYFPVSPIGKIISIITAFWGGFIISLMIVSVQGIFSLSTKEQRAFHNLVLVKKAARTLVSALRYNVIVKRIKENKELIKARKEELIIEYIPEKTKLNAAKRLYKRLAKFTEAAKNVQKYRDDGDGSNEVEELGQEMIEMNIKIEKMGEMVTACYNILKQ